MTSMKRNRSINYSVDEKSRLITLVTQNLIILNKKTDAYTNKLKDNAWKKLTEQFSSISTMPRQMESLKKTWNKLKQDAKTYRAKERINSVTTGGGPSDFKSDPLLDMVLDAIGRAGSGITDIDDCDNDMQIQEEGPGSFQYHNDQQSITIEVDECISEEQLKDTLDNPKDDPIPSTSACAVINSTGKTPSNPLKRRRPWISTTNERSKLDALTATKIVTEKKKQEAIEDEMERSTELHQLRKKSLEKDLELKELLIQKITDSEPLDMGKILQLLEKK